MRKLIVIIVVIVLLACGIEDNNTNVTIEHVPRNDVNPHRQMQADDTPATPVKVAE